VANMVIIDVGGGDVHDAIFLIEKPEKPE